MGAKKNSILGFGANISVVPLIDLLRYIQYSSNWLQLMRMLSINLSNHMKVFVASSFLQVLKLYRQTIQSLMLGHVGSSILY